MPLVAYKNSWCFNTSMMNHLYNIYNTFTCYIEFNIAHDIENISGSIKFIAKIRYAETFNLIDYVY